MAEHVEASVLLFVQREGDEGEFKKTELNKTTHYSNITNSELTFNFRFAKNEKYLRGEFERVNLGTDKPVFNVNLTFGLSNIFKSQ